MISHIPIEGCALVPVQANADARGCLYEIFRESWPGAFATVQWNACASSAGVLRGIHVHADYDEFYTLPRGHVIVGLADIRRDSRTFGKSVQFEWRDADAVAVTVPRGVAHAVHFVADSVLAFGLSSYWRADTDILGCRADAPELGFDWPDGALRSARDSHSGGYGEMVEGYERLTRELGLAAGA